jgi:hypothetical protein
MTTCDLLVIRFLLNMPTWKDFDEPAYVRVLDEAKAKGIKLFSAAYTHNHLPIYADAFPKRSEERRSDKHPRYILLLKVMMEADVTRKLQAARSYREAFGVLNEFPLHSDFIGCST